MLRWARVRLSLRPYEAVLRALESGGLRAAQTHFDESFRPFLRARAGTAAAGDAAARSAGAALADFCSSPADVAPYAVLMIKVFRDLGNLEDVRLLFALALQAIPRPPVVLFNEYLRSIAGGDTYTEAEIDNVADIMRARGVEPDMESHLWLLQFALRLGHDITPLWPTHASRLEAAVQQATSRRPTADSAAAEVGFGHAIVAALTAALVAHQHTTMVADLFRAALAFSPDLVTRGHLLAVLFAATNNSSMPTTLIGDVLRARKAKLDKPAKRAESSATETLEREGTSNALPQGPRRWLGDEDSFLNEAVIMRMLRACAVAGDSKTFSDVLTLLPPLSPPAAAAAALLRLQALVVAHERSDITVNGFAAALMHFVEDELKSDEQCHVRQQRVTFGDSTLLHSNPVRNAVLAVARGGPAAVDAAFACVERRKADGKRVTHRSLGLIVAAWAELGDTARLATALDSFAGFGLKPDSESLHHRLRAVGAAATSPLDAEKATAEALSDAEALKVPLTESCAGEVLRTAVALGDVPAALRALELHRQRGWPVDHRAATRLLRQLCSLVDEAGIRAVLAALRETRTNVDTKVVSLCIATLRANSIPCDDLRQYS